MIEVRHVAGEVVASLKQSPLLLGVLVLNLIMVVGAVYFLLKFGEANAARFQLILDRCLPAR